ncbi:unnamed protein product [Lactuca virosa]|uniref:Gamma-glutamylcyclotransferase n=1 Tax=Lactuca virosa TaxID=75947 RepID=A0AAU9MRJ1_9ASTR|nr:unnamed protein product [Lactuca virosa]
MSPPFPVEQFQILEIIQELFGISGSLRVITTKYGNKKKQIATATGPCGNNRDYIFLLEKAMFDIGHEDDMVIKLANEVRKVLGNTGLGVPKESNNSNSNNNRLTGPSHKPKSPHKLLHLLEAIAMDS